MSASPKELLSIASKTSGSRVMVYAPAKKSLVDGLKITHISEKKMMASCRVR